MEFPIIRVRDKGEKGKGFVVGANHHHKLIVGENSNIQFVNLQNSDATGKEDGYGYEFVSKKGFWGEKLIEFGSIWDILSLYSKDIGIKENGLDKEYKDVLKKLKAICEKSISLNEEEKDKMIEEIFKKY